MVKKYFRILYIFLCLFFFLSTTKQVHASVCVEIQGTNRASLNSDLVSAGKPCADHGFNGIPKGGQSYTNYVDYKNSNQYVLNNYHYKNNGDCSGLSFGNLFKECDPNNSCSSFGSGAACSTSIPQHYAFFSAYKDLNGVTAYVAGYCGQNNYCSVMPQACGTDLINRGTCQFSSCNTNYQQDAGVNCAPPQGIYCCKPKTCQTSGGTCQKNACPGQGPDGGNGLMGPQGGVQGTATTWFGCTSSNQFCCIPPTSTAPSGTNCEAAGDICVSNPGNGETATACSTANQGDPVDKSCNPNNTGPNGWTCCVKTSETGNPPGGGNPTNPTPPPTCGTDNNSLNGQCTAGSCPAGSYDSATCTGTDTCCKAADNGLNGVFDTANTTNFAGWACQPYNNYADTLTINFYADGDNKTGRLLGSARASQKVADISPECGTSDNQNSQNHSFSFDPTTLSDWDVNQIPNTVSAYAINASNGKEELLNPGQISVGNGGITNPEPTGTNGNPQPTGTGTTGNPNPTGTNGTSPTPTGGPTPTPNLTPQPAVANVSLQVDSIDAVDAANKRVPVNKKRHLTLYLYKDETYKTDPNGTSPKAIKATGDIYFTTGDPNVQGSYGTYVNAQFPLGKIPSGDYYIFGKTEGSLREPLTDTPQKISINNGIVNNLTFSQKLPMGLLSTGNTIGALDFSDLATCYGDKANSASCVALGLNDDIFSSVPFADFNMDGVVDGIDYNIWARNFGRSGL